jgi:SNF2 family DNA or RNA helicase
LTWSDKEKENSKHCLECVELARQANAISDKGTGLPPSSAKIRKVMEILQDVDKKSGSKEKTIVFSQFTSFLNLLEPFLKHAGVAFVRCESIFNGSGGRGGLRSIDDGKMHNDKRQKSLNSIADEKSDVRVILISFKAGSTGEFG